MTIYDEDVDDEREEVDRQTKGRTNDDGTDGRTKGRRKGWMNGQRDGQTMGTGWMHEDVKGRLDELTDGPIATGPSDGPVGRTDGATDRRGQTVSRASKGPAQSSSETNPSDNASIS